MRLVEPGAQQQQAGRRVSVVSRLTRGHFGEGKHRAKVAQYITKDVPADVLRTPLHDDGGSRPLSFAAPSAADAAADATANAGANSVAEQKSPTSRRHLAVKESFDRHAWKLQKQQDELKQRSQQSMRRKMQKRKQQRNDLLSRFTALDTNGDGVLSMEELRGILPASAVAEEIDELMLSLDTNGDGTINMSEFRSIVQNLGEFHEEVKRIVARFHAVDADGDGRISAIELLRLLPDDFVIADAELMMHQYDREQCSTLGLHDLRMLLEASGGVAKGEGIVPLDSAWAHAWRSEARRVDEILRSFRARRGIPARGLEHPLERSLLLPLLTESFVDAETSTNDDYGIALLCSHCAGAALNAPGADSAYAHHVPSTELFHLVEVVTKRKLGVSPAKRRRSSMLFEENVASGGRHTIAPMVLPLAIAEVPQRALAKLAVERNTTRDVAREAARALEREKEKQGRVSPTPVSTRHDRGSGAAAAPALGSPRAATAMRVGAAAATAAAPARALLADDAPQCSLLDQLRAMGRDERAALLAEAGVAAEQHAAAPTSLSPPTLRAQLAALSATDRSAFLSAAGLQGVVPAPLALAAQLRTLATTQGAAEGEAILADAGFARAEPSAPPSLVSQLRAVASREERVAILAHGCAAPSELFDALDGAVARRGETGGDAGANGLSAFDLSVISLCRELRNPAGSDMVAGEERCSTPGGERDAERNELRGRIGALVASEHMLQCGNPLGGALCSIATELNLGADEWTIVRRECEVASSALGVAWNIAPARRFPAAAAPRAKRGSAFATMIAAQNDRGSDERAASKVGLVTGDALIPLAAATSVAAVSATTAAALIAQSPISTPVPRVHAPVATVDAAAALTAVDAAAAENTAKRIWKAKADKKSGRTYYINKVTKETTWTNPGDGVLIVKSPKRPASAASASASRVASGPGATPAAAAAASSASATQTAISTPASDAAASPARIWKTKVDRSSGRTYYINTATKETTWINPGDQLLLLASPKKKQKRRAKTPEGKGLNATQMEALRSDVGGDAAESSPSTKKMRRAAKVSATPTKKSPTTTTKRAPVSPGKKANARKKKTIRKKKKKKVVKKKTKKSAM